MMMILVCTNICAFSMIFKPVKIFSQGFLFFVLLMQAQASWYRCELFFLFFSMHVLPGCHKTGVWEHSAAVNFHIDYGMVDTPDPSKVTMVIVAHPWTLSYYRWYQLCCHQVMPCSLMESYHTTHPKMLLITCKKFLNNTYISYLLIQAEIASVSLCC